MESAEVFIPASNEENSHACMGGYLTNAARVNTPPLGAFQFPCPAACGGVIDFDDDQMMRRRHIDPYCNL